MKTKRQTDANTHTHTLSTLSEKKENVIETNEMEKRVPNTMRRKVRKYYFICYKTSKRKKKQAAIWRPHCICYKRSQTEKAQFECVARVSTSNTRIKWEIYIYFICRMAYYSVVYLCSTLSYILRFVVYRYTMRWRIKYDRCAQQQREKQKKKTNKNGCLRLASVTNIFKMRSNVLCVCVYVQDSLSSVSVWVCGRVFWVCVCVSVHEHV